MGKMWGGLGLIALSLFMLLGFFNVGQPMSLPVAVLTLLVAVGVPAAGGAGLIYLHLRERGVVGSREERVRLQTWIAETLAVAQRKAGRLTVVELVAETAMDTTEAELALRALLERGIAEIEITESGLLVYTFHDVAMLGEKGESRRVIDA